jgi:uncharacterized protein (DUF433 family)
MIGFGRILKWRPRGMATQTNTARIGTDDPREVPLYSLNEAAVYLGIPASTLRSWIRGRTYPTQTGPRYFRPLIEAADSVQGRLSFANLAEAHILQATRDKKIPLPKVRSAIDYVQANIAGPHPLISADFHHFGKDLFIRQLEGDPINVSRAGQLGIRQILNELLERLERDKTGYPIRIFPLRTEHLVLDVNVASGQPVVRGTRIPARVLWSRRVAGDSVSELASDYGITEGDVEEAIRHFDAA